MWEFDIVIRSFEEVRGFVALANTQPFSVLVGRGNRWVNGKSFIGMFSLDFRNPLTVRIRCTEGEFDSFRDSAARFRASSIRL